MTELRNHVMKNVPRCIAGVNAVPSVVIDPRNCVVATFTLTRKHTSETAAQILGFPLADYNPACSKEPDFISPLILRWADGGEDVIFDSDIHGYHGEMQASAKFHGQGTARAFTCLKCGHDEFSVAVQFDYWDACDDLWEDEPHIPIQDYFCNIIVAGTCLQCGTRNHVLDMDL